MTFIYSVTMIDKLGHVSMCSIHKGRDTAEAKAHEVGKARGMALETSLDGSFSYYDDRGSYLSVIPVLLED